MKHVIVFFFYTGRRDSEERIVIASSWANIPYDKPLRAMLPQLAGESDGMFPEKGDERRGIITLLVDDGKVTDEVRWAKDGLEGEWYEPTLVQVLSE